MGLFNWLFGRKTETDDPGDEIRRIVTGGAPAPRRPPLSPAVKAYVTRLCRVHATVGSFAAAETRQIGEEIFGQNGHSGMVEVCDAVRAQLGGGPARDLEYKWNGIGEWRG